MTAKTTITIAAQYPDGTDLVNKRVVVALIHGGAGGTVDDVLIADSTTVTIEADGASVDLYPTDAISPAGTHYAFAVKGVVPSIVRLIAVPADEDPVSWTDPAILLEDPAPPTVLPAPTSGEAFDMPIVDAEGKVYGLGRPAASSVTYGEGTVEDALDGNTVAFNEVFVAFTAEHAARVAADVAINATLDATDIRTLTPGLSIPSDTPYLLVGNDGATGSHYSTPHPSGLTFDGGLDGEFVAAMLDDYGVAFTFAEVGTHVREDNPFDFDMNEDAFFPTRGKIELFTEHVEVGMPIVEAGELDAGRIYTNTVGHFVPWGTIVRWRKTIRNDDGTGHGIVTIWRPALGDETPDETVRGKRWMIVARNVLDDPTSVMVDPDGTWNCGFGQGKFAVISSTYYEYGGTDIVLAARAVDVQLDGTLLDPAGNVWTPTGNATVVDPSEGASATTDASLLTSGTLNAARLPAGAAAYPYPDRAHIIFAIDEPSTTVGTWAPATGVNGAITGGYAVTGTTVGDTTWTYANIQLQAGTYKPELIYRGSTAAGIATITVNGITGTVDTYRASTANDQRATPSGTFTVATSGPITVAISNPTKASGSAYGLSLQSLTLRRTGA